jgi:hypothetical protein
LELRGTELPAGDFRIDILAEDAAGDPFIIENQFGATDHKHLGQLPSYLASQGTKATVVWIAERIRDEHRAAIDWLNANTGEGFNFFAVEIEALRIGASDPAPFFNVVSKPNDWARSVGAVARQSSSGELAERHRVRIAYWAALGEYLRSRKSVFRIRRDVKDTWCEFPIGRSGVVISATMSPTKRRIGVELYNYRDPLKACIRQLEAEKPQIEAEFGEPLEWLEMPGKKGSRIAVYRHNVDPADAATLGDLHAWTLDRMERFRRVFAERVKRLPLDAGEPAEDDVRDNV